MDKFYGILSDYALVRQDGSRTIVSMGLEPEADGVHYTWYEAYWYKKPHPVVTIEEVKSAFIEGLNAETDKKILEGYEWNGMKVWLSTENQFNYKAAYDLAVQSGGLSLPVTFKFGTDEEPKYYEFTNLSEFTEFYTGCVKHVSDMLAEGWKKKDSIDWEAYKTALDELFGKKE